MLRLRPLSQHLIVRTQSACVILVRIHASMRWRQNQSGSLVPYELWLNELLIARFHWAKKQVCRTLIVVEYTYEKHLCYWRHSQLIFSTTSTPNADAQEKRDAYAKEGTIIGPHSCTKQWTDANTIKRWAANCVLYRVVLPHCVSLRWFLTKGCFQRPIHWTTLSLNKHERSLWMDPIKELKMQKAIKGGGEQANKHFFSYISLDSIQSKFTKTYDNWTACKETTFEYQGKWFDRIF